MDGRSAWTANAFGRDVSCFRNDQASGRPLHVIRGDRASGLATGRLRARSAEWRHHHPVRENQRTYAQRFEKRHGARLLRVHIRINGSRMREVTPPVVPPALTFLAPASVRTP